MLADDTELLDLMLADQARAPREFQPTNYWANYIPVILAELRSKGLRGFRGREGSFLGTFGATDATPKWRVLLDNRRFNNPVTRRVPGLYHAMTLLDRLLTDIVSRRLLHGDMLYGLSADEIEQRAYEFAAEEGIRAKAKPLAQLNISLEGAPKRVFWRDGRPMTVSMLNYYLRYAYVSRFTNWEKTTSIVELGSGSGKQVEVTLKLHPNLCFYLFDVPPQLYVAEQYLKSVFGERSVVSYRDCRGLTALPEPEPGKICLLGNWQFPVIEAARSYLFWNAASLQEMEPSIVSRYLASVERSAEAIYLNEVMTGVARASRPGDHGVLEQTKLEHYERALSSFRRIDMRPALAPLTTHPGYSDSFWERVKA